MGALWLWGLGLAVLTFDARAALSPADLNPYAYYEAEVISIPGDFQRAVPVDLNEANALLCRAESRDTGPARGFLAKEGAVIDLGTLGGAACRPLALDARERVVGSAQDPHGRFLPFVWQEGVMSPLPQPECFTEGEARALAADGTIGGTVSTPALARAVLWRHDGPSFLPLHPGYPCTRLEGLAGEYAVGTAFPAPGQEDRGRAVLWRGGEVLDLGVTRGYSFSAGRAVNAAGQVLFRSFEPPYWSSMTRWSEARAERLYTSGVRCETRFLDDAGNASGSVDSGPIHRAYGQFGALWPGNTSGGGFILDGRVVGEVRMVKEVCAFNSSGRMAVELGYTHAGAGNVPALLRRIEARMKLTAEVRSAPAAIGEEGVVRFTLRNEGPDRAYDANLHFDFNGGVVGLRAESSQGTPRIYDGYGYLLLETLAAGQAVIVDVTVQARAPGVLKTRAWVSAKNVPESSDTRAEASLTLAGTPLPDLRIPTGEPGYRLYRQGRTPRHVLHAFSAIHNDGTAASRPTWVRVYLGEGPELRKEDRLLRRVRLPSLAAGGWHNLGISVNLRQAPLGEYLKFAIDREHRVKESDETNNLRAISIQSVD